MLPISLFLILQKQIDAEAANGHLSAEIAELRDRNRDLQGELDKLLSVRDELSQSRVDFDSKYTNMKEKLVIASKNLTSKTEQIKELEDTKQKLTAQVTSLSAAIDSERRRTSELQEFVSRLQADTETANKRLREASNALVCWCLRVVLT